ncbi:hypothetical protein Tco_1078187 [Tanacetum coccineum]
MLVDALLQHEMEGQVNVMVEKGNVRTMNNGRGGCSYKEFMACNQKDYDRKGGAIVYTRWIKKMESIQDMSGCGENQKDRGQEAAVGMTWEEFKTFTREEFCSNNEMQKLETKFWCHAMVRAGHLRTLIDFISLLDLCDGGNNGANNNSKCCTNS